MSVRSNSDLSEASPYASDFPSLAVVLSHQASLDRFHDHDVLARKYKLRYNGMGIAAVALALLAVLGEVLTLGRYLAGQNTEKSVSLFAASAGVVALALVAVAWVARLRHRWAENVFVRERIRQWRFQQCLNLNLLVLSPPEQAHALNLAWDEMLQLMTISDGAMRVFVRDTEGSSDLLLPSTLGPIDDPRARDITQALEILRLDHQAAFAANRLAREDVGSVLGTVNRLTENVAVWAFASAVVVTVFELASNVVHSASHSGLASAIALGLLAVSAGVRSLRSGLVLPELVESFEEYALACGRIKLRYEEAEQLSVKLDLLLDLEREAAAELRRYLRGVLRSRYLL